MNESQLKLVKKEIEKIAAQGHGEVVVKIRNGSVWRVLSTRDVLVELTSKVQSDIVEVAEKHKDSVKL